MVSVAVPLTPAPNDPIVHETVPDELLHALPPEHDT
jgi:hypothetical protein